MCLAKSHLIRQEHQYQYQWYEHARRAYGRNTTIQIDVSLHPKSKVRADVNRLCCWLIILRTLQDDQKWIDCCGDH